MKYQVVLNVPATQRVQEVEAENANDALAQVVPAEGEVVVEVKVAPAEEV